MRKFLLDYHQHFSTCSQNIILFTVIVESSKLSLTQSILHQHNLSPSPLPDPSIGCHHNGTVYGDGSLVPTMEPCLSCKCAHRTLLCSLRVCHDLPVPPPRGCVIVHHKNKCCPHMFCKRFHKRPMISDKDRRIVNFLDEFEQEQQDVHQRYDQFDGGENALRRRSDDPDSFDECKSCLVMLIPELLLL